MCLLADVRIIKVYKFTHGNGYTGVGMNIFGCGS